jgi:hypothetical protein
MRTAQNGFFLKSKNETILVLFIYYSSICESYYIFKKFQNNLAPPPRIGGSLLRNWMENQIHSTHCSFFIPFNLLTFHYFSYVLRKADYRKGMDKNQFWMSDSE